MGRTFKTKKINPFPGLRPFLPEESDLFFGRDRESEEVLRKLLNNRFITVIGASGNGKSSLISCGVLPGIKKSLVNNSGSWKILQLRPGNDPIGNLTDIFAETISGREKNEALRTSVSSVLNSNTDGITAVVKEMVIKGDEKVLIIIDQFEELFRYNSTNTGIIPGDKAASFVTLLENAVGQTTVEIFLIISMRSDFIGECTHFKGLTQLINSSNYFVPHMNRENYRAAIEGPVKYAGASVDPILVETILNDIGDQPGQLSVFQHALMRTWLHWQALDEPDRPISLADYDSVGTVYDAMSRHANEAYEELSKRGREICEKTFRAITEKGTNNKGVRHPARLKSIKSIVQCTSEELFDVIEKFRIASRSFLTPAENIPLTEDSVIDLSQDSLMHMWNRLKAWIDDEAAAVQMYFRLSEVSAMYQQGKTTLLRPPDLQLAITWREKFKPTLTWAERFNPAFERAMVYLRTSEKEFLAEEENKIHLRKKIMKRTKSIALVFGGAAIIAVGFMLFAFVQKISADRTSFIADIRRQWAEREIQTADSLTNAAFYQKSLADSSAIEARLRAIEAEKQRVKADSQKQIAVFNAFLAQKNEEIAKQQTDSLTVTKDLALKNEKIARQQRDEALRMRMIAIGKSMSIRSMQVQGQKDLQTLLAYQAYLFNKKNDGPANDADIYSGLYNVAKHYGNVNYKTFTGHNGEIKSIAFAPGKREFYTSGFDGKVLRWNLDDKKQNIQVISSGTEIVEVLSVSPDAGWLACGGSNSVIKMIPIKGNSIGYELKGHSGKIKSLLFSFDGNYLYSASLDGKVLKWDLSARTSKNVNTDLLQINSIDISSNGNYLAGVSNDGKVLVWDPEKTTNTFRIETTGKVIKTVRFKPNENTLAIGYTDGYVELWDISSKEKISEIKAHTAEVNDIRFNNKYFQMATASNDGTLKLWDTRDLTTPPVNLTDNEGFVMVMEFSSDGQLIVSGTYEGPTNLVGRPTYVDLMAQDICTLVSRNLSPQEWSAYVAKDIGYEKTCTDRDYNIKVNIIK
jgi:WD40 repeat protein